MTGKQWTVGWKDRGMGHGDYGVIDETGKLIAEVKTGMGEDACLLAAAPDLLHELGGIADALAADETITIEPGSVKAKRIEAAIAKAEKAQSEEPIE